MQQQNWPIDANAKVADNATKTPPKPQALPPAAAPAPALPAKGLNPDALLGAVVRQLQEAAS
jgi:hypothetical protein